jgi:hypothetical protein
MTRFRALHDRLLSTLLPGVLAAVLLAGQWLSAQHGVLHPPGSRQSVAAVGLSKPATKTVHADPAGHAHGDATCIVIAHLLLSTPPTSDRVIGDAGIGSATPGWTPVAAPVATGGHRLQAARAPPLSLA